MFLLWVTASDIIAEVDLIPVHPQPNIILSAPFTVCFPERISNIQKCQNAPFLVSYSGSNHIGASQETPFILACNNIDYLHFGNVKFNDKSLTLCDQEKP